jgi:hypothetical protein
MRRLSIAAWMLVCLMTASCGGGGPSEQEIVDSLEAELRSVAGAWVGVSTGPNAVRVEFTLQEGGNGQVTGSGTFKETNAPFAVPIAITGTFQRPVLTLAINGVVYESHQASGTASGSYVTVGGISTTLHLTGTGYSRDVAILLQEQ